MILVPLALNEAPSAPPRSCWGSPTVPTASVPPPDGSRENEEPPPPRQRDRGSLSGASSCRLRHHSASARDKAERQSHPASGLASTPRVSSILRPDMYTKTLALFRLFANEENGEWKLDVPAWPLALEETPWRTIEERLGFLRASMVSVSTRSSVGRGGGTRPAVSLLPLCLVFVWSLLVDLWVLITSDMEEPLPGDG
jgi:hypothetical protein